MSRCDTKTMLPARSFLSASIIVTLFLACLSVGRAESPALSASAEQAVREWVDEGRRRVRGNEVEAGLSLLERAVAGAPNDLLVGNAYRMEIIRSGEFDRSIGFLKAQIEKDESSGALRISLALAYVDKLSRPGTSPIRQGKLSNKSIAQLDVVLAIDPENWVALFSRGMNGLQWPRSRSRAPEAIRDLEKCLVLQSSGAAPRGMPRVLPHVALGDAQVKNDDLAAARRVWREALDLFPGNEALIHRLSLDDESLPQYVDRERGSGRGISTDLSYLAQPDPSVSAP